MLIQKYDYTPINRQSVDGRRLYSLPDGSNVPSVTTILDATKPAESKLALENWRKSVGEQKAREITTEAANRGTRMHKWLENYVRNNRDMGKPGTNPYSIQSYNMAQKIVNEGLVHVDEVWGIEVPLYVSGIYAGTTDACGVHKGKPAILDYKQTNKPKKLEYVQDYFLQLVFYGTAHNHMFNTTIKQGVILMAVAPKPNEEVQYQTWTVEGAEWDRYEHLMWNRIEEYYTKF